MRSIHLLTAAALVAALSGCHDTASGPPGVPVAAASTRGPSEGFPTPGERRTGWIFSETGQPMNVTFEVHGGRAIFEGDIDLGPAGGIAATREALVPAPQGLQPRKGVIINDNPHRWPNGVVPYVISPSLPDQGRVTGALAHIQSNNASVQFIARTTEADYISFEPSTGCASWVGRVGGAQTVQLANGCSMGNTIHEVLHALGMHHEQSRCDRDGFVEVLSANIDPQQAYNFDRQCAGYLDVYAYAEGSIMHYGPYAYSINGLPTIRSLRGLDNLMGQRNGQGTTDIQTVAYMYPPIVGTPVMSGTVSSGSPVPEWTSPTVTGGDPANTRYYLYREAVYKNGTSEPEALIASDYYSNQYLDLSKTVTSYNGTTNPGPKFNWLAYRVEAQNGTGRSRSSARIYYKMP